MFNEEKTFSYRDYKNQTQLTNAIKKLYGEKIFKLIKKGLSACIYTQVSDVEEEVNGLITYDRKVKKISEEDMRELNEKLYSEANKINEQFIKLGFKKVEFS